MFPPIQKPGANPSIEEIFRDRNSVLGRHRAIAFSGQNFAAPVAFPNTRLVDVSFPFPLDLHITLIAQTDLQSGPQGKALFYLPRWRVNRGGQGADDSQTIECGVFPDVSQSVADSVLTMRKELVVTAESLQIDMLGTSFGDPAGGLPQNGGPLNASAYVTLATSPPRDQRIAPVRLNSPNGSSIGPGPLAAIQIDPSDAPIAGPLVLGAQNTGLVFWEVGVLEANPAAGVDFIIADTFGHRLFTGDDSRLVWRGPPGFMESLSVTLNSAHHLYIAQYQAMELRGGL